MSMGVLNQLGGYKKHEKELLSLLSLEVNNKPLNVYFCNLCMLYHSLT